MDIAARGKVKTSFITKQIGALKDVYEGLEAGTIAGRVVLRI
jgi:propanol-preferring alcohol dehydrogenase